MTLTGLKHAIGVFPNRQEAEQALNQRLSTCYNCLVLLDKRGG